MRFLFATDLHGDTQRYTELGLMADELGADAIVVGGDLCPKFGGDIFEDQAKFYGWLREWADAQTAPVYAYPANDDVMCLLDVFHDECTKSRNLRPLEAEGNIEGFSYVRYNYVPDTPFGLKDWSKLDSRGWSIPPQYSLHPVVSTSYQAYRFEVVKYLEKFLDIRNTIEEDLANLKTLPVLAFMHTPPASMSLDVTADGQRVGSIAIRNWIEKVKPAATFHGHIHESYRMTGQWRQNHGDTMCIQPGDQHFVVVDIRWDDHAFPRVEAKILRY